MVLLFLLLLAVPSYGEIAAAANFKTFAREQLTFQDLNSWQTANTAKLNELLAVANSDSLKADVGGVDTLTTKTAANAAIILNKAIKSKDPQDSIMAFNARLDTARVSRMLLGTSNIATLPMVGFPISASAGTRVSLGSLVAVDSLRIRDSLTVAAGARAHLPRSRIDTLLIGTATPTVGFPVSVTAGQRALFGSVVQADTIRSDSISVTGDVSIGDDLLLTSTAAIINFVAGDVTVTHATNQLSFAGGNTLFNSQIVIIGDGTVTGNANETIGLTIDQRGNDDTALALKSSDVAHGITTQEETDTWLSVVKRSADSGGAIILGLTEDAIGITIDGAYVTDNMTKTTGGTGAIELRALKKSGTTWAGVGADANMVVISDAAGNGTRFIFDAEGTGHSDVAWTTYDAHDDLAIIFDMEQELLNREDEAQTARRKMLEDLGVIGKGSWHMEGGRPRAMVNWTRLSMLHHGALIQVGDRLDRLDGQGQDILDLRETVQQTHVSLYTIEEVLDSLRTENASLRQRVAGLEAPTFSAPAGPMIFERSY